MIVVVFGLPGSGKSYFACELSKIMNATYIKSDEVRKDLQSTATYSYKDKLSVYEEMLLKLKVIINQKESCVLDATFYKNTIREKFIREAQIEGGITFIEIIAHEAVIKERLKKTRLDSEANFEVYQIVKDQWEPLQQPHLVLRSTNDNIDEMLFKAAAYLHVEDDNGTNK